MGHHPWSEIKRVRDIKRADDGLPESDPEPTTGAPLANELVYGSEATSQRPWTTGLVAFLCVAVVILSMGMGIVIGSRIAADDVNVEGHKGDVLVDIDNDGNFEWVPEGELHEQRGHGDATLPDPMGVGDEADPG